MSDETKGVPILDQGILAGDLFIDRDEHFLFPQQLEEMAELHPLPLNQLPHGHGRGKVAGQIAFAVGRLQLSCQHDGDHALWCSSLLGVGGEIALVSVIDSVRFSNDNGSDMQSLDIQSPGMPDLQFVLFVSALCTADLNTMNISDDLRRTIFDRCWALIHTEAPPTDPQKRVLDLRHGTELTLEACVSTIRSLLLDAGMARLEWDHPVSEPTHESTPEAKPLIDRLARLYPADPDIVDPPGHPSEGHA